MPRRKVRYIVHTPYGTYIASEFTHTDFGCVFVDASNGKVNMYFTNGNILVTDLRAHEEAKS